MSEQIDTTYDSWVGVARSIAIREVETAHKGETTIYNILARPSNVTDLANFIDIKCVAPGCDCGLVVSVLLPPNKMCMFPMPPGFDFVRDDYDLTGMEMVGDHEGTTRKRSG